MQTQTFLAGATFVPPGVEKQDFRDAMARLGSAVNIITTDGPAGRAGFTASAVCSVTDTPPDTTGVPEPLRLSIFGVQAKSDAVRQYAGSRTRVAVCSVWRQNADGHALFRRPLVHAGNRRSHSAWCGGLLRLPDKPNYQRRHP